MNREMTKLSILVICYDLQSTSALTDINVTRKIALKEALKIQRTLSVSLVKIDGSSMSLMGICES